MLVIVNVISSVIWTTTRENVPLDNFLSVKKQLHFLVIRFLVSYSLYLTEIFKLIYEL